MIKRIQMQSNTPTRDHGTPTKKFVVMALVIMLFGLGSTGSASAQDEAFTIEFDESLVHEGQGFYGYPGFHAGNGLVPPEPSAKAHVTGVIDENQILVEESGFVVGPGAMPLGPDTFFGVDWRNDGDIRGTYDSDSGAMTLNLNLLQTIETENTRCSVGPVPVVLSTEKTGDVGSGVRFGDGLEGSGVLVGSWASVPNPTGEDCDLRALGCQPRQHLLKGPGAFGLARGDGGRLEAVVPGLDDWTVDKFGVEGYVRDGGCTPDPDDPGPVPDPDLSVDLWRVSVGPRQAVFKASVTNVGGPAAEVTLCGKAMRGPRLRVRGCHQVETLADGGSFTRRLTVMLSADRVKRRRQLRRASLKVTLKAEGQAPSTVTRRIRGPVRKR